MGRADEPTPKRCFESVQLGITPGGGGRRARQGDQQGGHGYGPLRGRDPIQGGSMGRGGNG